MKRESSCSRSSKRGYIVWRGVASHFERKRRGGGEREGLAWLDVCVWAAVVVYLFSLSDCRVEGKKAVVGGWMGGGGKKKKPLLWLLLLLLLMLYTRFHQFHYRPLLNNKPDLTHSLLSVSLTRQRLTLFLFLSVCVCVCR